MTSLTNAQRLAFYRHVLVPLPPPPSRIPELVMASMALLWLAVLVFLLLQ